MTHLERPGPIDRTPGIPGSDEKLIMKQYFLCFLVILHLPSLNSHCFTVLFSKLQSINSQHQHKILEKSVLKISTLVIEPGGPPGDSGDEDQGEGFKPGLQQQR